MIYEASIVAPIYNEINFLNTLCYKIKDTFQNIFLVISIC